MTLSLYLIQQIWTFFNALIFLYKQVKSLWTLKIDTATGMQYKRLFFGTFFASELILA